MRLGRWRIAYWKKLKENMSLMCFVWRFWLYNSFCAAELFINIWSAPRCFYTFYTEQAMRIKVRCLLRQIRVVPVVWSTRNIQCRLLGLFLHAFKGSPSWLGSNLQDYIHSLQQRSIIWRSRRKREFQAKPAGGSLWRNAQRGHKSADSNCSPLSWKLGTWGFHRSSMLRWLEK